jgi:uncharacterized protein (TIGR03435 family)
MDINRLAVRFMLSALLLSALAVGGAVVSAQIAGPAFDVASVKPNKTGDQNSRVGMSPNGRFMATNITLKQLITNAYNLRGFQVTGGPDWLDVDRFDISATVGHAIQPGPAGLPPELIQMVKNLLADRFKLRAHPETKDGAIYQLLLARPDGRLGPKLRPAELDCSALMARGGPPPTAAPGEMPPCSTRITNGRLTGRGGPIDRIVRTFAGLQGVERIIVDKTGLTGSFDVDLEWTQDPSVDATGPSLFTALQEQLGLKLEPARGPVEVLVIESAAQPSPD